MEAEQTWAGTWVTLSLATFGCSCTAGEFAYDWSSPQAALVSLQRAFEQDDGEAIASGIFASAGNVDDLRAEFQRKPEQMRALGLLLRQLEPRQVDGKLSYGLRGKVERRTPGVDDAVRIVGNIRSGPGALHRWAPELENIGAVYMVRQGEGWKWYLHPYELLEHWSYDFRTPTKAYESVLLAVDEHDVLAIYGVTDPEVLGGVDREQFQATALERLAAIDVWQRGRLAREFAMHQGQKIPEEQPQPFLPIRGSNGGKREVEEFTQNGTQCARVWQLSPADGKRTSSEEFVKRGERWFWRPKNEYDVWPLPNRPGAASPATTHKPGEPSASSARDVRINWSELATGTRAASRPASQPATATAPE